MIPARASAGLVASAPLVVFTSGSSGQPQPVYKNFDQLQAEIEMLEATFGSLSSEVCFARSVSHHHMFGLVLSLLWPACSGRIFVSRLLNYWEDIASCAETLPLVLITSPPHLDNLPENVQCSLVRVFSAGAALHPRAWQACYQQLHVQPSEIYGSTETGAVAYRERADANWHTFDRIRVGVSTQGCLHIISPAAVANEFLSKDRCECLSDTEFRLNGRVDSVVKVGAKRISLSQIEQRLQLHTAVESARVIQLASHKDRLAAVLKLSPQGQSALIDKGKKAMNMSLRASLRDVIDAVAIPRFWRYVNQFQLDTQGKISHASLAALFSGQPKPKFGDILAVNQTGIKAVELELFVRPDICYFDGHFEASPVLAGVVQVLWARHYAEQYLNVKIDPKVIETLKFQKVIFPGQRVLLRLAAHDKLPKISFNYGSARGAHSSGKLVVLV